MKMVQLTDWHKNKEDVLFATETLIKYNVPHEVRQFGDEFAVWCEKC